MVEIKAKDKKRYVLKEAEDYKILEKIYELEKRKLSLEDRRMINLIKTQLEQNWRKPLIEFLNELLKRYQGDAKL